MLLYAVKEINVLTNMDPFPSLGYSILYILHIAIFSCHAEVVVHRLAVFRDRSNASRTE